MREVIVCSQCGGEDCRVDELLETKRIPMQEYANRQAFPPDIYTAVTRTVRTARNMVITCQKCGHQHEYIERIVYDDDRVRD